MIEMKTLKINDKTYEIVDEKARTEIADLRENGTGGGSVSEEDVRNAIESYMEENPVQIPSEYITETELEEAMANVPTSSGGMSVSYDEEQEAIVFSGSTGGESGSGSVKEWTKIGEFEFTSENPLMEMEIDNLGGMTSFIFFCEKLKSTHTADSGMTIEINGSREGIGAHNVVPVFKNSASYCCYVRLYFDGFCWNLIKGGNASSTGNYSTAGIQTPYDLKRGGSVANSIRIIQHLQYFAIEGKLTIWGGK